MYADSFANLLTKMTGAALIIDYGENHSFSDSFRVFYKLLGNS